MLYLKHLVIFLYLTTFIGKYSYAQDLIDTASTDFYPEMKHYDLAKIFMTDSIIFEDHDHSKNKIKRDETLGFIGKNYQRFYIHFISAIKNVKYPNEYTVTGKTKVKENICSFQGTIKINKTRIYKHGEVPKYKQGFAICMVKLYEDKHQSSAGCIEGKLTSKFIIDDKNQFRYDNLFDGDDFSNNEFEGVWTSYKTNTKKICNWGDYRIPNCGDLDSGADEFSASEKYVHNGWDTFNQAGIGNPHDPETIKAQQIENIKWWE